MSYTLTLTAGERQAFDWVGGRYDSTGDSAYRLLVQCLPEDSEGWDDEGDLTFVLPEYVAWDLRYLAQEEDYLWPCFAPALASKMQALCDSIV